MGRRYREAGCRDAVQLDLPALARVVRPENGSVVADGPPGLDVHEGDSRERDADGDLRLPPCRSGIVGHQDDASLSDDDQPRPRQRGVQEDRPGGLLGDDRRPLRRLDDPRR